MNLSILKAYSEISPTRNFDLTYVVLDSIFLLVLIGLLAYKKKYMTLIWSLFGGILYFIVDFGLFYLASGSRHVLINDVEQGSLYVALVLLWMSLSYGITNFAFIWLCLDRDKNLKEWLLLIVGWWLVAPSLQHIYMSNITITTFRTTNKYHYIMAIFLVVGYLYLIVRNLVSKKEKINLLRLNIIGISVQFAWEFALLVNGIRPMNEISIMTLLVNSFIETNMGMPYMYFIYKFFTDRYTEELKDRRKIIENDQLTSEVM